MDEYLKTKEEIIKHFDVNLGLIDKAERIIAIMAKWRQNGNGVGDATPYKMVQGVSGIGIGEEKESIIATAILSQYNICGMNTWEIEIPIEYFNMLEGEIDAVEEHYYNIRIKAYRNEAKRRAEEEERQKKICAEEKEKRERELYEQLKKKYG